MTLRRSVSVLGLLLCCGVAAAQQASVRQEASWEDEADRWAAASTGSGVWTWLQQASRVDFDGDGTVGFADFLLFARSYNTVTGDAGFNAQMDLNADGAVDFTDFLSFGAAYNGQTEPQQASPRYRIYVADFGEGSLTALDSESHLITDYLVFRGPSSVWIASDGQAIYVSEGFGLFAIDPAHQSLFSIPMDSPGRIAMSPDERTLYLTQEAGDQLLAIDLDARQVVDSVAVGDTPIDLDITPDGRRLYVANADSRDITVVDAATMTAVGRVDLGATPREIGIAPNGLSAYVTDLDRGVISVVDLRTNLVAGGIALSGAFARGLAFSPDGGTLYVTSATSLVAVDVSKNLVVRTLALGDDTSTLAVTPDGSRIYAASLIYSKGGPGLSVVDVADWRILGRIRGFLFPAEIQFLSVSASGVAR